jgi:hypothetical protein
MVKGDIVPDTTDPGDPAILLPVQDGILSDCQKKDIKFVRIQLTLDFSPLVNATLTAGPTILQAEYYIELPQTSWQLTNGTGNAYTLLTFHGVSDLRTLSPADVQAQLLSRWTHQPSTSPLQPLVGEN